MAKVSQMISKVAKEVGFNPRSLDKHAMKDMLGLLAIKTTVDLLPYVLPGGMEYAISGSSAQFMLTDQRGRAKLRQMVQDEGYNPKRMLRALKSKGKPHPPFLPKDLDVGVSLRDYLSNKIQGNLRQNNVPFKEEFYNKDHAHVLVDKPGVVHACKTFLGGNYLSSLEERLILPLDISPTLDRLGPDMTKNRLTFVEPLEGALGYY